jgi:hypothetical protein
MKSFIALLLRAAYSSHSKFPIRSKLVSMDGALTLTDSFRTTASSQARYIRQYRWGFPAALLRAKTVGISLKALRDVVTPLIHRRPAIVLGNFNAKSSMGRHIRIASVAHWNPTIRQPKSGGWVARAASVVEVDRTKGIGLVPSQALSASLHAVWWLCH